MSKPAILQLATRSTAFVFRLSPFLSLPTAVIEPLLALLSSDSTLKIGVGVDEDVHGLRTLFGIDTFVPAGFVRMEELAHRAGLTKKGLASLAEELLGKPMQKLKFLQLSNWEADLLTPEQLSYAATGTTSDDLIYASKNECVFAFPHTHTLTIR